MAEEAQKDYMTVIEFNKKYDVPTSTLYYMLNRDIVKLRMVNTQYGKRKKFSEAEMAAALKERVLL